MPRKTLYTIGYEGALLDDLIESLLAAGITHLVDVRERAQSRRKGFSKTALRLALNARGIGYTHLRALGDPKPGREAARSGNYTLFRKIYGSALAAESAKLALSQLIEFSRHSSVCLLCYELDAVQCHRSIVAKRVCDVTGARISDLSATSFRKAA